MLPTTGLFKSFPCPYFDGVGGGSGGSAATTCNRPYCHFKHVRKEDIEQTAAVVAAVPEYTPAPKLLSLPSFLMPASRRKPQLEYQPEKPGINASPSKRKIAAGEPQSSAPVYIPATTDSCDVTGTLDECKDELEELSGIIGTQMLDLDENSKENEEDGCGVNQPMNEHKEEQKPKDNHKKSDEVVADSKELTTCDAKKSGSRDHRHSEKHRDSSSSSGSRNKHKSSSKSHEREERQSSKDDKKHNDNGKEKDKDKDRHRDKQKEKERDSDRNKRNTSKEKHVSSSSAKKSSPGSTSSPGSKHKISSSSSKGGEKDKHRASSSSSSKHKSSSSSSASKSSRSHHHHHTSSSHSSSSSSSKNKDRKASTVSVEMTPAMEDDMGFDAETEEIFATTEEEIMKECAMIYDQMEEEFAKMHSSNDYKAAKQKEEAAKAALKRKHSEDSDAQAELASAALVKKRVAYENADKQKSHKPLVAHKPNHIRNAMQAIFQRQAEMKRKQEEEAAAAVNDLREAEEKVREANEALRKAKEKNLTPLIPKSFLTPPTRPSRLIAPVANMLALERAKKKVEELKADKRPAFTPCQITKGTPRVAHTVTAAATALQPDTKPKPPVLEANSTKISFNIRMQYYEMMVKHCATIYPNKVDAWERAQIEELAVFKKCRTPIIYKSSASLAINKLRKEAADAGHKTSLSNQLLSHEVILAGKLAQDTSWSVQKKIKTDATTFGERFDKLPGSEAYEMVCELRLTPEQLISNGYPRAGKRPGTAILTSLKPMRRPNATERYCSRCGKVFSTVMYDETCVDECNYHPKGTGYRRGFVDHYHRCCQQPAGTPGCTYANYHVSDYVDVDNLSGYVSTIEKGDGYVPTKKDIYAVDCEMCYTTHGVELTRVTVVDINSRTVYDALVKPDNKIVDYNTVYSGITEQMLANETRSLRDVQAILMSMFHSQTVLVGHSLESDLKALKLIHGTVVDTSVLFPHKMGPPKKRALKTLCIENLKRIIQENEAGHDSAEDAEVCIQLVKFYLRNKIS